MAGHELIDDYLADVARRLRWRPDVDALTDELRDHLYCAVERRTAAGIPSAAAQTETLNQFGPPGDIAMNFATTGTTGLAVPTSFTVSAGRLALASAIGWVLVPVLMLASDLTDQATGSWEGAPQRLFMTGMSVMMLSAVLAAVVVVAMVQRHGGLGIVGNLGIGLAVVGALATFVAWFYPGWGSLIGLGAVIMAIAMWRRSIAPQRSTIAFGLAWPLAGVTGFVLRLLEVGRVDEWGDYPAAWLGGLAVGCVLFAAALAGLGRWLRSEEPVTEEAIQAAALARNAS